MSGNVQLSDNNLSTGGQSKFPCHTLSLPLKPISHLTSFNHMMTNWTFSEVLLPDHFGIALRCLYLEKIAAKFPHKNKKPVHYNIVFFGHWPLKSFSGQGFALHCNLRCASEWYLKHIVATCFRIDPRLSPTRTSFPKCTICDPFRTFEHCKNETMV